MATIDVRDVIARCFLFRDLSDDEQTAVIENGWLNRVPAEAYFFHQGEEALTMYVLLEGRVKLTKVNTSGDQIVVNYFGPGDGLGIIVALSYMKYPLSAQAIEDCLSIAWEREAMHGLMRRHPNLALNGIEIIGRRFASLQERYVEISTERVEQRIARALLRLVRQYGRRVEKGVLIDMPISRQDLAEMTGTNLYNVSRIMSRWEREGLVESSRMQVTLCRAHELVAIAEDLPNDPRSG
jgi:CRP/FNR family transcriptional regulator, nitrogen oxide reductase regulator